ncbi:DNA (cytosine-5)-methyltransferase 1 [Geodermatophilus telluris]|uniref:Cytosine-specific methyltransferase n=1 Tax=Geodermatophilus telluris TaxID=1190417 RepID=A0A1G6PD29_9ACTN|nr:DNA (cytosine-5)-methyltransferase 1 [Geodermatophilus telluris]
MATPLRVIDLFAGCGGLTQGFKETGHFEPVAAVEHDLAAAATYAANFGEDHVHWGKIEDWVTGELPDADVVVGGPPCQGFSSLNKRRIDDPRNELWRHYVETLIKVQPRAFLIENVDRFGASDQFQMLRQETDSGGLLEDYQIDARIVRATEFGAAQLRRRFIVIGTHRELSKIDVPTGSVPQDEWRTVRQALEGLDEVVHPDDQRLPSMTTEAFGRVLPGVFKSPDLHLTRNYQDLSLKRFRHIPPGGDRRNLPNKLKAPCWIGHNSGSFDVMGRMHWNRPSVTIRTEFFKPEKGRYLHPEQPRAITHHEAARLQGFPDEFLWCGGKLDIARQIGNAVPVELARGLAQHIASALGR